MSLSCARYLVVSQPSRLTAAGSLTGTFFCEMTTAQSLPRTPSDVMLAAVMALKAYSGGARDWHVRTEEGDSGRASMHTDLVQAALVGEDGDVAVVACASYTADAAVSGRFRG